MANYQETTLAGTAYTRASEVYIINREDAKSIMFQEQRVVTLDDGEVIRRSAGQVVSPFTPENAGTAIPLLNPETGESLGASMTYEELYVALYSLYLKLAQERDYAEANPEPTLPEAPVV